MHPRRPPTGIPWLKLDVISHRGSGVLSDVTTVQRINTLGGELEGSCEKAGNSLQHALRGGLRLPAEELSDVEP